MTEETKKPCVTCKEITKMLPGQTQCNKCYDLTLAIKADPLLAKNIIAEQLPAASLSSLLLSSIASIKTRLYEAMLQEVTVKRNLMITTEYAKLAEDEVVIEIWADVQYKNDRQRSQAKHLARINDSRIIVEQAKKVQAEQAVAMAIWKIKDLETQLAETLINYELAALGRRDGSNKLTPLPSVEPEKTATAHVPVISTTEGTRATEYTRLDTGVRTRVIIEEEEPSGEIRQFNSHLEIVEESDGVVYKEEQMTKLDVKPGSEAEKVRFLAKKRGVTQEDLDAALLRKPKGDKDSYSREGWDV